MSTTLNKGLVIFPILTVGMGIALLVVWLRWRTYARAEYVRTYMFPPGLFDKLRAKHPGLSTKECQLVAHALRQFFLSYLKSGCQLVAMPSQVADDLWHEMILYTRHYERFCKQAFGQFMHHTPAAVMGTNRRSNTGLRRAWWHCCLQENINPRKPTRLPLLFVLDDKLKIANGFKYTLDCSGLRRQGETDATGAVYCGGDFADASFDGSTDGFGDGGGSGSSSDSGSTSSSDSSNSSSSSSSDGGGSGCSGGCSGGCGGD
jgi:hypothetical protein